MGSKLALGRALESLWGLEWVLAWELELASA